MSKLILSPNALTVLEKRYLKKDETGRVVETPEEMFRRVARAIAEAERAYDHQADTGGWAEKFYQMMARLELLPNSPTLFNAGTKLGMLSACFVVPVTDDLRGIFNAVKHAALIQQAGGGVGFSFSRLRPKGDIVRSTGGQASGPVSFMQVFNMVTEVIKQGGRRRGALMGILRVDHPDILDFIVCKEKERALANFNISVAITEEFMRALEGDGEYGLRNPRTGEVVKKLRAREVFNRIVEGAWRNGEPGVVFIDRINESNPTPNLGSIESTNPCVAGDTLVATESGWLRADELKPGVKIVTPQGLKPLGKVYDNGVQRIYLVKASDGSQLKCTQDHKLLVVGDGELRFTPLKEIRPGDIVARLEVNDAEELGRLREEKIVSIAPLGMERVYDVYEPDTLTWITNGFVSLDCGEQPLLPHESCNLASINLSKMVADGRIDWAKLERTVKLATRFLDNVITVNKFPLPEIEEATLRTRKIGLGVMGFADMLIQLGIPYDSEEAEALASKIMEAINYWSKEASIELAKKRGSFPAFEGSIYAQGKLPIPMSNDQIPMTKSQALVGDLRFDWWELVERIRKHGIRNATTTTIAPTGSIGIIAGCSGGIEPLFALVYTRRHILDEDQLIQANPFFEKVAKERGFYSEELVARIAENGSCRRLSEVPEDVQRVFVTAYDVSPEWHVRMQAAFQRYTDNAVSKCVAGDTLIFTGEGIRRIDEFYRGEVADSFRELDLLVAGNPRPVMADLFYYGGHKPVIGVETDLGLRLEGTLNHRVRVIHNGQILWRCMDELAEGDYLIVPYGYNVFGNQHDFSKIYGTPYRPASRTVAKTLKWPYKITTDLARAIGYLVSDGGFNQNSVIFFQADEEILKDYVEIMARRFHVEPAVRADKRQKGLKLAVINSPDLITFFADYLGIGKGAGNKRTPACILRSGREIQKEFIKGLTLDGHVSTQNGRFIVVGTVSRRLAEEVQAMLLNLGLPCRLEAKPIYYDYIHEENRKEYIYNVVIVSSFRRAFLERIGFAEAHKQEAAWTILKRTKAHTKPGTSYVIPGIRPLAVSLARQKLAKAFSKKLKDYLHSFITADVEMTRATLLYLLDICQDLESTPEWQTLNAIAQVKALYTPVTRLWRRVVPVYDLHVPEIHSFVTNGFISHNTINLPNSATREDIAQAYLLAYRLGCKGVTVYRDKSREEQVLNRGITEPKPSKVVLAPRPRPAVTRGTTEKIVLGCNRTLYVTINEDDEGLCEVFLHMGKSGGCMASQSEAIGRLISLALRSGIETEAIIKQLKGIRCPSPSWHNGGSALSCSDAIAKSIERYIRGNASNPRRVIVKSLIDISPECPECGEILEPSEGCVVCRSCGYSECL